jgi:hypothetical protein
MKVTVEIPDEQWARLRARARAQGCDEPAMLVEEAVEEYLGVQQPGFGVKLPGYGVLSEERAEELRAHVQKLRRNWRDAD